MGRYWALWLLSVLMRLIGVLCIIYCLIAIANLLLNELGYVQLPTSTTNFETLLSLSWTIITYNFWAYYGIPIAIGWYGVGQLLVLLMDMQQNGEVRTRIMRAQLPRREQSQESDGLAPLPPSPNTPSWRSNRPLDPVPPSTIETRRFRRRDDVERERLFASMEEPRPAQPHGRSPSQIARDLQRQEALRAQRIAPQPPGQDDV